MKPKSGPLAQVVAEIKAKKSHAQELREKIHQIEENINTLMNSKVSLDDFSIFLRKYIQLRGERFISDQRIEPIYLNGLSPSGAVCSPVINRSHAEFQNISVLSDFIGERFIVMDALCFFIPEQVEARWMSALKEKIGMHWSKNVLATVKECQQAVATHKEELQKLRSTLADCEAEIAGITDAVSGVESAPMEAPPLDDPSQEAPKAPNKHPGQKVENGRAISKHW